MKRLVIALAALSIAVTGVAPIAALPTTYAVAQGRKVG
jgi:hypothetical protein